MELGEPVFEQVEVNGIRNGYSILLVQYPVEKVCALIKYLNVMVQTTKLHTDKEQAIASAMQLIEKHNYAMNSVPL
ncbi:hypothetical protein [Scytonema sp. NUACC26]|uniref:hypothetical protein n=1 Tax=Scytonema sp. NUACC26 TaxID=3140176 RepID=UPI0034DC656A